MNILPQLADRLWGNKAKLRYLLVAAALLLLTALGAREIWTQEHRWADIVFGMFYRQDFLHPYLGESRYYDKPLLSYWLIALFMQLTGSMTTTMLRIPSALAGCVAIWSIYQLGAKIKNRQLGLLAGWLLLTTFYFVFWARTSSADMLNMAGSLLAVAWYFTKKDSANVLDYTIFFLIIALTALCKGLVGVIVPMLAILVDVTLQRSWRQHLRWPLLVSIIPALIIYVLPFWASNHFGGAAYGQSGLYLVYRENILRYFQPFDHQGPIYTYFIYLPIYLLPWAIFLLPAMRALKPRWISLSNDQKWIAITLAVLFAFFTLSGSRRSYYVLPIVPFAILFIADWMLSFMSSRAKIKYTLAGLTLASFVFLFAAVDILPAWYYSQFGVNRFATKLQTEANKIQPWQHWQIVMLDAESKLNFYLRLPPSTKNYHLNGTLRDEQTAQSILQQWPILLNKPANTIFISRKRYASLLKSYFTGYRVVELRAQPIPFLRNHDLNAPIAFIPSP